MTVRAAGILILSNKGNALFLKRGPGGDAPGLWCVPGGRLEDDEKSVDAAVRETLEETGGFKADKDALKIWSRTVTPRETTGAQPTPPPGGAQPAAPVGVDPANGATVLAGEDVEFTTFALTGVEEFVPDVSKSGEHTAFAWTPINDPPQPLHPGVQLALNRASMNELDVARAIRDGQLTSPQKYGNVYLFAIRITGTGQAYRSKHKEYVWRDPSLYLNEDFLARCNGLPVILEHPPNNVLDSQEYSKRNIGSIFLPYIQGDEVWGIAKVHDEPSALMMEQEQLSTSPAVLWFDSDASNTEAVVDGKKILIEGNPSLLDHIAICRQGVWDKGGDPTGVQLVRGDQEMTKEELEQIQARADADNKARHDKMMETMTGLGTVLAQLGATVTGLKTRMDAEDEKEAKAADSRKDSARGRADSFKFGARKDGEDDDSFKKRMDAEEKALCDAMEEAGETKEVAADKAKGRRDAAEEEDKKTADSARKDADDKEKEERAAADAARADSVDELKRKIELLTKGVSVEDQGKYAEVQARADSVLLAIGDRARAPMLGESLTAYRLHFVQKLQDMSPSWKGKDLKLAAAAGDEIFVPIADAVFNEALKEARSPAKIAPGTLRMDSRDDGFGHKINEFLGSPSAWMNPIAGHVKQAAKSFKNDGQLK